MSASEGGARVRALVADREPAARLALGRLLERCGCDPCLVRDAERALEEMRRRPPALALIDSDLPSRGGLDLVAEVRRDRSLDATRLVLLLPSFRPAEAEEAARRGADAVVRKPFSPAALSGRILDWTRTARSAQAAAPAAEPGRAPRTEE